MGNPAAIMGDTITGNDKHMIVSAGSSSPVDFTFSGIISGNTSSNVLIEGKPAALVGSTADNIPPHIPKGGSFATPPSNQATITTGSSTVMINGKPAARQGDEAQDCDDTGGGKSQVTGSASTVLIG